MPNEAVIEVLTLLENEADLKVVKASFIIDCQGSKYFVVSREITPYYYYSKPFSQIGVDTDKQKRKKRSSTQNNVVVE